MAAPVYSYTVHDLKTNAQVADLPLTNVRYTKRLNDSGTLSGTLTLGPGSRLRVADPYDATMPARRCIYAWRDGVPQWGGIIWTRSYDSRTRQVQIGCGDFWSYFDHRKVLNVLTLPVTPAFTVAQGVITYTGVEQNTIARNLITQAALHTGGDIGIVLDASTSVHPRTVSYRGYELQTVGQVLRQFSQLLGGPDVVFDVARTLDASGRPIRRMLQGTPHMGQQGSPWVWEYGGNLASYIWPSDGTRFATRAFASGEGSVEGTPIAVSENVTLYGAWPLMEVETAYTTVSATDPTTLQEHADADQQTAARPVVLAKLVVRGNMDPIVGAWSLGDDARVVIQDLFHANGIDAAMRIVAAEVATPQPGQDELVTLTAAPLLDALA